MPFCKGRISHYTLCPTPFTTWSITQSTQTTRPYLQHCCRRLRSYCWLVLSLIHSLSRKRLQLQFGLATWKNCRRVEESGKKIPSTFEEEYSKLRGRNEEEEWHLRTMNFIAAPRMCIFVSSNVRIQILLHRTIPRVCGWSQLYIPSLFPSSSSIVYPNSIQFPYGCHLSNYDSALYWNQSAVP